MKTICRIFLTVMLPFTVWAQHALTPEELLTFRRVGVPALSPSGKTIAYTVEEINMEKNKGFRDIYLQDISGAAPIRLTQTNDISENAPQFGPASDELYFISSESGSPQVWKMTLKGENRKQVTNVKDGIGAYIISKSGSKILYTADIKTTQSLQDRYPDAPMCKAVVTDDLMYRHWDSWDDYHSTHLFLADLTSLPVANGKDILGASEPFDVDAFKISADEKYIAYASKKLSGKAWAESTNSDIYLYDMMAGTATNISKENPGYDQNPVFSTNGHELVWEQMSTPGFESDKTSIIRYDYKSGKYNNLSADFEEGASNLSWSNDDKLLYFTAYIKATCQIFSLDLNGNKIKQITSGDHDFHSVSVSGKTLIGTLTGIQQPQEIYTVDAGTGAIKEISLMNADKLSKLKKGSIEKRMVKTTDGKDMLVWVIKPPDFDPAKKYPAILYCQGGPQSAVSCFFSYRWNLMLMASRGYVVIAPNRRGLPGFGKQWNDQISGDWGGQPMRDYLSAADDAAGLPYVNPERMAAVGASYGGYSVYWLAGNHKNRFKTFIAHCGLFNLESWYNSTEEMFFANQDLGGPYWKTELSGKYDSFSPHKFVKNWNTPLMVIHGEKDFRVPVGEGMQAFGAAQNRNLKSRFLYFPDEGHWVLKPQNAMVWHREFFRWLNETL